MGESELAPQLAVHFFRLGDDYFVHLRNGCGKLTGRSVKNEGDPCFWEGRSNLTQSWGGEDGIAYPLELEDENIHETDCCEMER